MSQSTPTYYYAGGQRQELIRKDDMIAVKLSEVDTSDAAKRAVRGVDVPDFVLPAAEGIWPGGEMILSQDPGITRSAGEQAQRLRAITERGDVAYASPVFEHSPGDYWIATNQLIVQFRDPFPESDVRALGSWYKLEIIERIDWLQRAYLMTTTSAAPGDALTMANRLIEEDHAIFAHPNFLRKFAHRAPIWQPKPEFAANYWHLNAIDAFDAWKITTGDPGIVIAIVDDGVDVDHTAFPNQAPTHFNVIDQSGNPRPPASETKDFDHGTACAGLALGATSLAVNTSGVAPGCSLMAVRLLDRVISEAAQDDLDEALSGQQIMEVARALSAADSFREGHAIHMAASNGAHVISNSWGPPDGMAKYGREYPLVDYARLAVEFAAEKGRDGKGCVICWAAGNGSESISFDGYASHRDVFAVAACTQENMCAPYSDYGPEVDIVAPGGGYRKGLLTSVAVDPEEHQAYRHDFNGTSAATPIVAGAAALLLSKHPDLTREEVYDILRSTADKIDQIGGKYDSGGHSHYYGYGRVNASKALEEASRRQPN